MRRRSQPRRRVRRPADGRMERRHNSAQAARPLPLIRRPNSPKPARSSPTRRSAQQALAATLDRQRAELAAARAPLRRSRRPARRRARRARRRHRRVRPRHAASSPGQRAGRRRSRRTSPSCSDQIDGARRRAGRASPPTIDRRTVELDRARGPPRGAPPIRLRAQPDVAARGHPLGRLARRGHHARSAT